MPLILPYYQVVKTKSSFGIPCKQAQDLLPTVFCEFWSVSTLNIFKYKYLYSHNVLPQSIIDLFTQRLFITPKTDRGRYSNILDNSNMYRNNQYLPVRPSVQAMTLVKINIS